MDKQHQNWDDPQLLRKKRIIGIASVAAVLLILIALTILLGKPIANAIRDKAGFRQWMQGTGFWKYPLMVGIMALQVIIAFIPGEPIEIMAGYVFGSWLGMLLCLLGTALGSVIIILAVRKFGMKLVTLFIQKEHLENLRFFKETKKRDATIFLLFLIPGTPKDILTYLAGLVPIHLGKYLLLTSIARIPSVISSTMGGNKLGTKQYGQAIIIFAITLVLTAIAALAYQQFQKRHPKQEDEDTGTAAQPAEGAQTPAETAGAEQAPATVENAPSPSVSPDTQLTSGAQVDESPAQANNHQPDAGMEPQQPGNEATTEDKPEEASNVPAQ